MSDVVLHPGSEEPYMARITLEHEGERGHEMYINRGEEAAGMIEHVSFAQFCEIAERLAVGTQ